MSNQERFAAAVLRTSASAYGAAAASRLVGGNAGRETLPLDEGWQAWQAHLLRRVVEPASALAAGAPALFANRIAWTRLAFAGREVPEPRLEDILACLRDVLAEELPPSTRAVVGPYMEAALEEARRPPETPRSALDGATATGRLVLDYLLAALEGDARRAITLVRGAVADGLPVESVYCDVVLPAQKEVGRMWHAGELAVAQEHFVTATTRRLMTLLWDDAPRAADTGRTVLLATVSGEIHDVAVQALSDLLDLDGWRAVCLGCDLPATDLAAAAEYFAADLVVLGVTRAEHLLAAEQAIGALRRVGSRHVPVLVGGLAYAEAPEVSARQGADAHAATLREALSLAADLVDGRP